MHGLFRRLSFPYSLLLLGFLFTLPFNAFASKTLTIFHIENTLITSKAVYAVKLNDNYKLLSKSPITNYWLRPNGSTRPVTWFENKIAYGLLYQKVSTNKTSIEFALSQYKTIKIIADIKNKKVNTFFFFKKKKYGLKKLIVKAKEGLIFPTVLYVDIIGFDIQSKKQIVQRVHEYDPYRLDDNFGY